ncbi:MAG: TIR domain-containing protein [Candidatus Coatesbacteria bacterium]
MNAVKYDVFLSYNSKNLAEARALRDTLKNSGFRVFFDEDSQRSGIVRKLIEDAIRNSLSFVFLVGQSGVGKWQHFELNLFTSFHVRHREKRPIIPVLIEGLDVHSRRLPDSLRIHRAVMLPSISKASAPQLVRLCELIPYEQAGGLATQDSVELERPFLTKAQKLLLNSTVAFYDENADRYYSEWRDHVPEGPMNTFMENVRTYNRKVLNPRIMDAGCGPGHHSLFFAKKGFLVEGIDLSTGFLKIANGHNHPRCRFAQQDMRFLDNKSEKRGQFDGVWACASVLHLPREALQPQLYQFLAALKPEGVLHLALQVNFPSALQIEGRFFERYAQRDVPNELQRLGFEIVSETTNITERSTTQERKVKKWLHVTAIAPRIRDRLRLVNRKVRGREQDHAKPIRPRN